VSVQAISLAFALRGLSASEKLVLLALANYADDQMKCWPKQETLAKDTELSARTIWAALGALEAVGAISRVKRKRSDGTRASDVITLHFAGELSRTPVANSAKTNRNPCENQSQSLPNPLAPVATLTTFEPSIEEPSKEPDARGRSDFPRDAFAIWYGGYPNKVGKDAAHRAFDAVRKARRATFAELIQGRDRYIRTKPPDRQWCNPATWLNQGRWLDEPADATDAAPPADYARHRRLEINLSPEELKAKFDAEIGDAA